MGNGQKQKKLAREVQEILYLDYGIDPIKGKEVLGWAPNRGTKGQHSYETLEALGKDIKAVKEIEGSYDDIVKVLDKHKKIAAQRVSTYKPKNAGVTTDRNGKCKK